MEKSIRIGNRLMDFSRPRVMAIINLSDESFYTSCSATDESALLAYVESALSKGADMLDVGACSTRPGSDPVSEQLEWERLSLGLRAIRHHWPEVILSVDTFRAAVADKALLAGADIINDVYGGEKEAAMWDVVAAHRVPYVLTHSMPIAPAENYDPTMSELLHYLQDRLYRLHRKGVADVIVDPGFGFGKTVEQNYAILRQLDLLDVLHAPVLVGVSRKSMLYRPLDATPDQVLPATVAAHTMALERGADILRVHDVEAAHQAIRIFELTHNK